MFAFLTKLLLIARSRLKSWASLEAETLVLRQQVIVLSRKSRSRVPLRHIDRLILVWLYRFFPSILNAIVIVKPETVIRWHRRGFRAYWRWKSRRRGGRPRIDGEIRDLIRRMSRDNPLWGAPRIHAELLMLGIEVAESTVGRYLPKRRQPPSQGWKTFLVQSRRRNRVDRSVRRAHDTVQAALWFSDSASRSTAAGNCQREPNPTAEWIAGQVTDALSVGMQAPKHLIRHRDAAFGPAYTRRIRAMGIRDHPTAPRSPWQNGHVERLIGSIRRECLDHVVVFGEAHLRRVLKTYASYYNKSGRTSHWIKMRRTSVAL